jgi:D-alanyl-D-alanine carboxypeptidase
MILNAITIIYLIIDLSGLNNSFILSVKDNLRDLYTKEFHKMVTNISPEIQFNNITLNPSKNDPNNITLNAKSFYSVDLKTNTILESKNENEKMQIASLTKLMTVYVVLKEDKLNDVVTINSVNSRSDDAKMGLTVGDRITKENLLKGLLINSGSDAALSLATSNSGSVDEFVLKMNSYANKLGLNNTNFTNPVGWDDENNYSSAKDIANLSRVLLNSQDFREIVAINHTSVYTEAGRQINLNSTNQLISEGFSGIKTGYTPTAGECLAALYKKDSTEIVTVIIGSPNRFYETRALKDWINNHFLW